MKRVGIFSFYDREGIVDKYVEFLLKELCCCLDYLVIVINGDISDEGKLILESYADNLYIRENKGFDGGAYKDVIVNKLGWNRIQEYDELVLCNDTFYGPFVQFKTIFEAMKNERVDFWGLNYYQNNIVNHLQSYFLVFKGKIISEHNFINYLKNNINVHTNNINEIYADFEVGLFSFLISKGYSYGSYSKGNPYNIYKYHNISIKDYSLPILKRKAFSPEHFNLLNVLDTLSYLNLNKCYDIKLILSNIKKVYNLDITKQDIKNFTPNINNNSVKYDIAKICDDDIKKIISTRKSLYIYGLGVFSSQISKKIDIYKGIITGYIVSDNQLNVPEYKNGIKVYKISEVVNTSNMVIIVALNKRHTQEVKEFLKGFDEVIFLW